MAELLECVLCGYQTVRAGMTNHIKHKHRESFYLHNSDVSKLTLSLGQIRYVSYPPFKVVKQK